MSITSSVHRSFWIGAVLALAMAVPLIDQPPSVAALSRPNAPNPPSAATANVPLARIAALNALVNTRDAARVAARLRREELVQRLADTHLAENAALARSDLLSQVATAAEARYRTVRAEVGALAASYYRNAGNPNVVLQLFRSRSPAEFGYRQKIVSDVGDRQTKIVKRARRARSASENAARDAGNEETRLHALIGSLQREIPTVDREIDRLQGALSLARFWLTRWQSIGAGVNTPIMSRSILSPTELADWFSGTHRRARITVAMSDLTQAFVEEGEAAKVRGDIAFAQSILETGSFFYPDGGQLQPTDNNFAGMDACDSCAKGKSFPDARTGVRAQMQLLRVYADANLTNAELNPPAVDPKLDTHFLKGRVPTWDGLTHTWATADQYGDRIIEIYAQILGWLTDHANL